MIEGDCLSVMPTLPEASVDAVCSDPPYGISFMGNEWDHGIPGAPFWKEALRVAKLGAWLLAFGGTRTFHRLACAIEDAGWEIRDCIMWVYGSGFPKSHNVSLGIDKGAGVVGNRGKAFRTAGAGNRVDIQGKNGKSGMAYMKPITEEARQWHGWGTALKPSWEPIIVARKPFKGTVAGNVVKHGTGAMNIKACTVGTEQVPNNAFQDGMKPFGSGAGHPYEQTINEGRWPANICHDGSEEVMALFPDTKSGAPGIMRKCVNESAAYGDESRKPGTPMTGFGDEGSAARFFYCAKASREDREEGCELIEKKSPGSDYRPNDDGEQGLASRLHGAAQNWHNHHPTVKPTDLMRWLVRLVCRKGGVVMDPFAGSGSTGKAAALEGMRFLGIEVSPEYIPIAVARVKWGVNRKLEQLF